MKLIRIEHSNKKYKKWVRIEWNIGKRCNFDCSYCPPNLHDNSSSHLNLDIVKKTIVAIKGFYKGKKLRISLTGGEPFLNPHIISMVKLLSENKFDEISLISNGSSSLKKYKESLQYVDNLILSWQHEFINVNHIKEILNGLQNTKKHLHVHLMFLPGRLEEVKGIIKWLERHNTKYVVRKIRPLYDPNGGYNLPGASGLIGQHKPTPVITNYYTDDELKYLDTFNKSGSQDDNVRLFSMEENWTSNVNVLLKNQINEFKGWYCMAGVETLNIHHNGDVYNATCRQGGVVGNINNGFTLTNKPIICKKLYCNCAADLNTTKWKKL